MMQQKMRENYSLRKNGPCSNERFGAQTLNPLPAFSFFQGNLSELGRLLMQGSFSVWTEHKKGHAKVKDLARFKPMQRHLFLHQKALLFCKRREENGEGYEKAPSYSFKHSLSVSSRCSDNSPHRQL